MADMPTVIDENTMSNSFVGDTKQVCLVTRDFYRTMEGMVRAGIGPWRVYTFGPETMTDITYRGKPSQHAMKLGLAFSGDMCWEIVQSLAGPNIYEEFLEKHGEGIHHIAFTCNDIPWEEQIRSFEDRGYTMIQSGLWQGKFPHAYFETEGETTTTFEIYANPKDFSWPEPEEWYPAPPPGA